MTDTEASLTEADGTALDDTALVDLARRLAETRSESSDEQRAVELVTDTMRTLGFEVTVDRNGNAIGTIGQARRGC